MAMFYKGEDESLPMNERTQIKEIPPASIRIQSVKTKKLKGFEKRVEEIRETEAQLIQRKQQRLQENAS